MDRKLIASFRRFAPPALLNEVRWRLSSHFDGDYATWAEAKKHCSGFDPSRALPRILKATRAVVNGSAAAEQNGVLRDHVDYSWPTLAAFMWVAGQDSRLRLVDFGGSLGTTYRQNARFLRSLKDVQWAVVEQPELVLAGKREFEDGRLQFFHELESAFTAIQANVVFLSNALQYLEKPYEMLNRAFKLGARYVVLDRTPVIEGDKDRLTRQVHANQADAGSQPAWFFSHQRLFAHVQERYELVAEFESPERVNVPSRFVGALFARK
jgi:putative methyltransferase (TIGR04325 family)